MKLGQSLKGIWVTFRFLAACDIWQQIHPWHKPIKINGIVPGMNLALSYEMFHAESDLRCTSSGCFPRYTARHAEILLPSLCLLLSPLRGLEFI